MTITKNDLKNVMKKYNANVNSKLDTKVDKISGKGLSTNDYTTTEKNKLAGIATGATNTVLNNTVTSTSTTEAATAYAVKTAYDKANHSHPYAATSHGNHVPTTQSANNAIFLRNDNTWAAITPANIGAATSSHTHTDLTNLTTRLTPKNDSNFDTFTENSFKAFSRYGISNSKFPSTSEMLINGISISRGTETETVLIGANVYSHGYGKKLICKIGTDNWDDIITASRLPYVMNPSYEGSLQIGTYTDNVTAWREHSVCRKTSAGNEKATLGVGAGGGAVIERLINGSQETRLEIRNGDIFVGNVGYRTKVPFSCTASSGYTILWQNCYTVNSMAYIHVRIKKNDSTTFQAAQHAVCTTPYSSGAARIPLTLMPYLDKNYVTMGTCTQNGVLWQGNQLYITAMNTNSYGFEIFANYAI